MLDGCTSAGSNGSRRRLPALISATRSRSESSIAAPYLPAIAVRVSVRRLEHMFDMMVAWLPGPNSPAAEPAARRGRPRPAAAVRPRPGLPRHRPRRRRAPGAPRLPGHHRRGPVLLRRRLAQTRATSNATAATPCTRSRPRTATTRRTWPAAPARDATAAWSPGWPARCARAAGRLAAVRVHRRGRDGAPARRRPVRCRWRSPRNTPPVHRIWRDPAGRPALPIGRSLLVAQRDGPDGSLTEWRPDTCPTIGYSGAARGCSSMAEHQLPKLTVRVRFPSPAPRTKALVRTESQTRVFRV